MYAFDMPPGYFGFLFRGADEELYFAVYIDERWSVKEFSHIACGRTVYNEAGKRN